MSGFITTMFVSSTTEFHSAFPAKPKPLLPIFTFAQSQSCINLRMNLDVLDVQEKGLASEGVPRAALDLARPKDTYQSPLQRIGEALRLPQPSIDSISNTLQPIAQADPPPSPGRSSPTREFINYSYKMLSGGGASATDLTPPNDAALDSSRDQRGSIDTGSIIGPAARQPPQNRGYFAGTSLLSSFFSNPRTRAPFKPQKSNRGTSSWQLKQYAEATLGSGSLRKAVRLPEGEDKDEWLAVNGG